jgi:hypothetical protein
VGMRNTLSLWEPTDETVEAIAAVLCSRWSAARTQQPSGLFWPSTTNWVRQQARRLVRSAWALQRACTAESQLGQPHLQALTRETRR